MKLRNSSSHLKVGAVTCSTHSYFESDDFINHHKLTLNSSYAMLSCGIPWNMHRVTCIFRVHMSVFSENFGIGSKAIFRSFHNFLKFSINLRKSSEVFGKFTDVIGNVRNGSQELKSFGAGF